MKRSADTAAADAGAKAGAAPADKADKPHGGGASGVEPAPESGEVQVVPQVEPAPVDDRLLRVMADFDNYRKRALREKAEVHRQAQEELMRSLLSALDHLDLALAAADEHDAAGPVVEGFRLVSDELLGALRKHGLKAMDARGEPFDPHRHEAIAYVPSADAPPDHVVEQTRRGYMLGDRLLRPAQVVVASGAAPTAPEEKAKG
jgi:molecular chaperone GrpE